MPAGRPSSAVLHGVRPLSLRTVGVWSFACRAYGQDPAPLLDRRVGRVQTVQSGDAADNRSGSVGGRAEVAAAAATTTTKILFVIAQTGDGTGRKK